MPTYLRLDLFPTTVTFADGTALRTARAVVSEDTLYVFQDASPAPSLTYSTTLYDFSVKGRTRYEVVTDDEYDVITIEKQPGCGCGNKLRGFRPFPGVPLVKNTQ